MSTPKEVQSLDISEYGNYTDGLSLIEVLEKCLADRDTLHDHTKREQESQQQKNKRLLVAVAAENRRWRQQYKQSSLSFPSLLELAENALGEAYIKVCEDLQPAADYCGLLWTPSAVDHNNEPCRIKRAKPAIESWSSD
mmetsp:Transcript_41661/g.109884  ORF Transcript_41661/g.109884 Transcript_41661/m.109884 type:complete len:139 (-) Transcript_41661:391-807(-)|eukprot:CAMPEP_0115859514 /NCGR_PEP_ID=MMETSP0287-20121206/16654_1 /TAXON_ID=412157 /ORGANISM="Chrysochromulina rotalis, Strain UIO044" /LENGTH=138 /DNA_ID=CAMNT_0003313815 /DNA_START=29 /DNA_END=445 /DNA_ORIENTATION=-